MKYLSGMGWHSDPFSITVFVNLVATTLPGEFETRPFQYSNNLRSRYAW